MDAMGISRGHKRRAHPTRLDKDFGELAIVYGKPHCGIIRLVDLPVRQQGSYCVTVLERFAEDLARGAILTVSSQQVRIRPAN
jgi:predicted nuclease of predicted toxin-antitoxin system